MSEKEAQSKQETEEAMWREQIKKNNIENQFKGEKCMIGGGWFP